MRPKSVRSIIRRWRHFEGAARSRYLVQPLTTVWQVNACPVFVTCEYGIHCPKNCRALYPL